MEKYRVWEPLNKKMYYLNFSLYERDEYNRVNKFILPSNHQFSGYNNYSYMNLNTVKVMKYIGLHDSKGNEIYEGDIICAKSKLNKDENFYFTIYFGTDGKNYGWGLKKMGKTSNGLRTDILYWVNNGVKVVGNIYEGILNEKN